MATPGQEDGPRALLEAGLVKRLEAAGIAVGRGGQVTLFRWRPDPDNASAANAGAVIDVPARSLPRGRAGTLEVARRDARAALKGGRAAPESRGRSH